MLNRLILGSGLLFGSSVLAVDTATSLRLEKIVNDASLTSQVLSQSQQSSIISNIEAQIGKSIDDAVRRAVLKHIEAILEKNIENKVQTTVEKQIAAAINSAVENVVVPPLPPKELIMPPPPPKCLMPPMLPPMPM